jgi:hypothetical protein
VRRTPSLNRIAAATAVPVTAGLREDWHLTTNKSTHNNADYGYSRQTEMKPSRRMQISPNVKMSELGSRAKPSFLLPEQCLFGDFIGAEVHHCEGHQPAQARHTTGEQRPRPACPHDAAIRSGGSEGTPQRTNKYK